MALSLVEGMSEEWKPEQYHDTYKEDVLALVKKKIKAGRPRPSPHRTGGRRPQGVQCGGSGGAAAG
jgi:non-homologous end joining protein Ku